MTPKKKKIYIIITCICFGLSIGIMWWTFFGFPQRQVSDSPDFGPLVTPPSQGQAPLATGDVVTGFNGPAVFPKTNVFNTEVLKSPAFLKLKPFNPIVPGTLGRENPFNPF